MKRVFALLITLCLLLFGCNKEETVYEAPELLSPVGVNVDTATVTRGDIVDVTYYEGSLSPCATALSFSADGAIDAIYYYPGQTVEEGALLMTIDQEEILEKIESLEETIQYVTQEGVYDDGIRDLEIAEKQLTLDRYLSQEEYDTVQRDLLILDVQNAQLQKKHAVENREAELSEYNRQLEELQTKLTESNLLAPHSGIVYFGDNITEGAYVQEDKTVCYVIDTNDMLFTLSTYVSQTDLETYDYYILLNGKEWEAELVPMSEEELLAISAAGKTIKRSFVLEGSDADLRSLSEGGYGVLVMETKHITNALQVPVNAVKSDSSGKYVYLISENGEREKCYFSYGYSNGVVMEVKAGLEEGDVIYVQN